MSLNELSNSVFPNTLNGLDSLNVTDITINGQTLNSLFVPYANAVSDTDLNNKSLTGVNTLSATSVIASGLVQGLNVTATGLTTTNTLKINSVPAGTVAKVLAVDASGNVIEGSLIPSQINVSAITPGYASPMYFSYLVTNSAGDRVLYVDTVDPISYNTNNKTLTIKNLSAPVGSNWYNYGTTFSATLQGSVLSITGSASFPQFCSFSTTPNVGTPAYFLGLNAVNEVVVSTGISAQPTITAVNANTISYLTFAPNATTTSSSPLYVDSTASLTYNAFSNTLTVPIADIPTSLSANGSFTANGTNSIAGYAPLNSPALTGIPTSTTGLAGTSSTQIATQEFVINSLPSLTGYIQKTGTQTGINTTLQLLNATSLFKVEGAAVRTYLCVDSALDRVEIGELRVLYGTTCQGGLGVGNIIQVYGSSNPLIDFGATTAIGKATAATGLISDSGASDLCVINYNTDIRFAARQNVTTNMLISNTEVVVYNALRTNNGASFRIAGNQLAGYNSIGLFADNAGFFTNHVGALTAGLTGTNAGDLVLYANASGELKFYTGNTRAITLNFDGMVVTRQYLHLNNAINPYLNVTPSGGNGNFFAQATDSGAFISGSAIGDLCINSRTGNIRLAGGSQFARTNMLLTNSGISCQASSMFDFSIGSAGGWTDSNSLHITTGGLGGNNAGVGIGFSTTLDSGLLCSIAPNVIWKPMTYKAAGHIFTNLNIPIVGINAVGVYAYSAGYLASYGQANSAGAGLTGGSAGDLVLYANNSNTLRIYAGLTQVSAFGTYAGAPLQLWKGTPVWYIEGGSVNIYINTAQVGYWDRGVGGSAWRIKSQEQLQIGGADGNIFHNFVTPSQDNNPFGPSSWDGGCLFTNTFGNSSFQQGFNIVYNETYGYTFLTSLQPSVAWKGLTISAGQTEVYFYGGFCAYTTSGGWVNVSDEREKEDIKLLKTNRSLERVLSAKTYSYKRKYYLNDKGNDLTPDEVRNKVLVGVMAQQIQESNPHCISTWNSNEAHEERFGVCYNDYVVHLLGAVQEQQKQIDQLVKKDVDKDATIQQLVAHVAKLTEVVNKLSSGAITPR